MRITALIVGVILTLATFLALCQAMLVPRQSNSLIVRAVNSVVSAAAQAPLPLMRSYRMQDRWLSGAAPMTVLIALVAYVVILIATLGLVVYGTTQLSLLESMYQSGSTLTTLGIVEPVNVPSAITTFIAAFLGLVVIAVFIGYLLAIYGAYVARESGMARVAMLAGEPAWGPVMIARGHLLGLPDREVPDASEWLNWICDTRLNSQVNPVLMRFRSTSGLRHWVTTTLAVMDAATLRVSTSDSAPDPHLVQVLTEGTLSLATLSGGTGATSAERLHNWDLERRILAAVEDAPPADATACGVTRTQFDNAMDMIDAAGVSVPLTRDQVWCRFATIRAVYYQDAATLAQQLHAVPAPWSGPRHPELAEIYPERPSRA